MDNLRALIFGTSQEEEEAPTNNNDSTAQAIAAAAASSGNGRINASETRRRIGAPYNSALLDSSSDEEEDLLSNQSDVTATSDTDNDDDENYTDNPDGTKNSAKRKSKRRDGVDDNDNGDNDNGNPLELWAQRIDAIFAQDPSTVEQALHYVPARLQPRKFNRKPPPSFVKLRESSVKEEEDGSSFQDEEVSETAAVVENTNGSSATRLKLEETGSDINNNNFDRKKKRKRQLKDEWYQVRKRWKHRRYDFRQELDVGGVVERVTRRQIIMASSSSAKSALDNSGDEDDVVMRSCQPQTPTSSFPSSVARTPASSKVVMFEESVKAGDGNDDDDYPDDVLNRLLLSQQSQSQTPTWGSPLSIRSIKREDNNNIAAANSTPFGKQNSAEDEDLRPHAERWDFHTLGYAAPRDRDLEFDYDDYLRRGSHYNQADVPDKVSSGSYNESLLASETLDFQSSNRLFEDGGNNQETALRSTLRLRVHGNRYHVRLRAGALSQCHVDPNDGSCNNANSNTVRLLDREPDPRHKLFHQELYASVSARRILSSAGGEASLDGINGLWRVSSVWQQRQALLHRTMGDAAIRFWQCSSDWNRRHRRFAWEQLQLLRSSTFYDSNDMLSMVTYHKHVQSRLVADEQQYPKMSWVPTDGQPLRDIESEGSTRLYFKPVPQLAPDCHYAFLPGTMPPLAQRPLDISRISNLGLADRNASVYHEAAVSKFGFQWTLAALVARYAMTHDCLEDDDVDDDDDGSDQTSEGDVARIREKSKLLHRQRTSLQHDLQSFITDQLNRRSQNSRYLFLRGTLRSFRELPLSGLNCAVMAYVSLAVNGCIGTPMPAESNPTNDDGSERAEDDSCTELKEAPLVNTMAEDTVKHLSAVIDHNGLAFFPRVHLVLGILKIAQVLPESASRILFTSLDDCGPYRTPVDLFRCFLEHLEVNELLTTRNSLSKDDGVSAIQLEYAIFQASQSFSRCIEREPTSFVFQSWYLGAQLALLVLCSGNQIGSGAHLFPSFAAPGDENQRMFSDLSGEKSLQAVHEVRPMLQKFYDQRVQIVAGLRLLLRLFKHQPSQHGRKIIVSLLEWQEAMALLVGRPEANENDGVDHNQQQLHSVFSSIRHDHTVCVRQWKERNGLTVRRHSDQGFSIDLRAAAKQLERDPSKICNWRNLVQVLGPLGTRFPQKVQFECRDCTDCHFLKYGLRLDHGRQLLMQSCASNWDQTLLWSSPNNVGSLVPFKHMVKLLKVRSQKTLGCRDAHRKAHEAYNDRRTAKVPFDWLDSIPCLRSTTDSNVPSVQDRSERFDDYLPAFTPGSFCSGEETSDSVGTSSTPSNNKGSIKRKRRVLPWTCPRNVDENDEVRAYSVYLQCFILGPSHPTVRASVLCLLKESVEIRSRGLYIGKFAMSYGRSISKCLEWLVEGGLALHKYLNDHILAEESEFGSEQVRKDIDQHIKDNFYLNSNIAIQTYESLKTMGVVKLRELYDVLVTAGHQPRNTHAMMKQLTKHRLTNKCWKIHTTPRKDGTIRPIVPLQTCQQSPYLFRTPQGSRARGYAWLGRLGFWVDKRGTWDPVLETTVYGEQEKKLANTRLEKYYANSTAPSGQGTQSSTTEASDGQLATRKRKGLFQVRATRRKRKQSQQLQKGDLYTVLPEVNPEQAKETEHDGEVVAV